jgi:integrase
MTQVRSVQSLVQEYLEERRSLGFDLARTGRELMSFSRFINNIGHRGPLTRKVIIDWAQGEARRAKPVTWARRLQDVRQFAKYCARFDADTEIPEADLFGRSYRRLAPHIYTDKEIADLVAAAHQLRPQGTLRPAMYATMFGLIAATGLRISEALHLRCADVNLAESALTVRQTKFNKSRLLPLHSTVTEALARYATLRMQHLPGSADDRFFAIASGAGPPAVTVRRVFARLRKQLGWSSRGAYAMPRIHDLRHTFICRRVMLWHEQGAPIDNAMAALSTYVGHVRVSDTYWYLTGTSELMAVVARRFERFVSDPESDNA